MNKALSIILLMAVMVSCTKGGDTIEVPDPTDAPSTKPLVTVVYDPDALGDHSYNDLVCQGVEAAAVKYGLRTMQLSPASREEGLAYLETIFQQMSTQRDTIRRLFVVASTGYDSWLRQNNSRLEGNPYADLLYLETDTPLEGKGSTLYIHYYGAMYEAGAITPCFSPDVLLVGANPENKSVAEAIQGFSDGYNTEYVTPSRNEEKHLNIRYIGQHEGEGYEISDDEALKMMTSVDWNRLFCIPMIVPVCGGAAMSFHRMADSVTQFLFMGVDAKKTSAECPYSAVKHIDRAVEVTIGQWLSAEGMPKHQSLGMADGYTEVLIHPVNGLFVSWYKNVPPEETLRAIHEEAVRKEGASLNDK